MGELALIDQIRRRAKTTENKSVTLGIGDDCAILRPLRDCEVLVTTDFTLEGRHFDRRLHPPESAGHRCIARGLSDLAAMGATPMAAFLSLALPPSMPRTKSGQQWITRFFNGLQALAEKYKVPLAGGDTSESPGGKSAPILADIVLIGSAPQGKSLRRSGAKPGDSLYVTGHLGGAAAEWAAMQSAKRIRITSPSNHPQLFPQPRIDTGKALLRRNLATACMDISDGLSTDLAHLCQASNVTAEIDQSALPLHPLAQKLSPHAAMNMALHGGEDYELLFTASKPMPRSIAGVPITRIGAIHQARKHSPLITLIAPTGERTPLNPAGWQHFSTNDTPR